VGEENRKELDAEQVGRHDTVLFALYKLGDLQLEAVELDCCLHAIVEQRFGTDQQLEYVEQFIVPEALVRSLKITPNRRIGGGSSLGNI